MERDNVVLIRPAPQKTPRVRMFCFAHAGGGASSFSPWARALPPQIEVCAVQLPGRETRFREVSERTMNALVNRLGRELSPWLDVRFVFFGHSMGSLVAFELARELRRRGMPQPAGLFVSAYRSPKVPHAFASYHDLSDNEFIVKVGARYGGIPAALAEDKELLQHYLPGLRADFALLSQYEFAPEEPLDCPFFVYNGLSDSLITPADVEVWRTLTSTSSVERWFPGGHFYIRSHRAAVLQSLANDLGSFQ